MPRIEPATDVGHRYNGLREPIEKTIARIKHNVVVTGTLTGSPGQESAVFQIEGMEDRRFHINTQLMDGFIIRKITGSTVVLKNQVGSETISLHVTSGNRFVEGAGTGDGFNKTSTERHEGSPSQHPPVGVNATYSPHSPAEYPQVTGRAYENIAAPGQPPEN